MIKSFIKLLLLFTFSQHAFSECGSKDFYLPESLLSIHYEKQIDDGDIGYLVYIDAPTNHHETTLSSIWIRHKDNNFQIPAKTKIENNKTTTWFYISAKDINKVTIDAGYVLPGGVKQKHAIRVTLQKPKDVQDGGA